MRVRRFSFLMGLLLCAPLSATCSENSWRTVSLPSRPLDITAQGHVLWVCGTDELIASSADGGKIWNIKHQSADGEILMHIGFANPKNGFAWGTNGLLVFTNDGGETWESAYSSNAEYPKLLSFADRLHGIRSTRRGLDDPAGDRLHGRRSAPGSIDITADGGATWQAVTPVKWDEDLARFPYIGGLAALDADHAVVLLMEGPLSGWKFLTTADWGKTWKVNFIEHTGIRSLVIRDGEYWAFGHEVIEREKRGGYGVALAIHSKDGEHWDHGVRSPKEYSECNSQGCILWDGVVVDVFHEKPIFFVVPNDGALTNQWATSGGTICSISDDLKCAQAAQSENLPPRSESSAVRQQMIQRPGGISSDCIQCAYPWLLILGDEAQRGVPNTRKPTAVSANVYFKIRKNGTVSDIEIERSRYFKMRENGTVSDIEITRSPSPEVSSAITKIVARWLFEPLLRNGTHIELHREVVLQFITTLPE